MYSDEELRHKVITLMKQESDRDRQRRVGASNLSNPCDYCLACALKGVDRSTPSSERDWMGREIGTAIHSLLEPRVKALHPQHPVEKRINIGTLGTYGPVFSTPDWVDVDENHLIDWKNSTIKKTVYLRDYLGQTAYGRDNRFEPIYTETSPGTYRKAKAIVSEFVYAEEMRKSEYKVRTYAGQLHLYARGLRAQGTPIERMSNVFIVRDSAGHFDNPALDGYSDNTKMHGVWILSFDYDSDYAEAVWNRGEAIWNALEGGAAVEDFARHELCFPCSVDLKELVKVAEQPIHEVPAPIAEVTFISEAA